MSTNISTHNSEPRSGGRLLPTLFWKTRTEDDGSHGLSLVAGISTCEDGVHARCFDVVSNEDDWEYANANTQEWEDVIAAESFLSQAVEVVSRRLDLTTFEKDDEDGAVNEVLRLTDQWQGFVDKSRSEWTCGRLAAVCLSTEDFSNAQRRWSTCPSLAAKQATSKAKKERRPSVHIRWAGDEVEVRDG
ncbi:hypothetical protein JCM24511_07971 [Saitozyma sp. JCM 24511]|nr:hypothetical protein JCM24511_07971 [Saitozyma sp. JCM 24511]